jgi:hypothetical protein
MLTAHLSVARYGTAARRAAARSTPAPRTPAVLVCGPVPSVRLQLPMRPCCARGARSIMLLRRGRVVSRRAMSTAATDVPHAMQQLARGAAAVVHGDLDSAGSALAAADHAFRENGGGPPHYSWPLRNAMGQLAHSRGDFATAKVELEAALELATESSMSGRGDDAFRDLCGCLLDLAALELQMRTPSDAKCAAQHVRRARYMSSHAYRPAAALQRPTQELFALASVQQSALGSAGPEDGGDMVRALLLDARNDDDAAAEGRALVALAGVALSDACDVPDEEKKAARKLLEKAARTARLALECTQKDTADLAATQLQAGGTSLAAAAVLASVDALLSSEHSDSSTVDNDATASSLADSLALLPENQLDTVLRHCAETHQEPEVTAAEACRQLSPQLGPQHLAVLQLRRQAAGGRQVVWGLCGSVAVPRCIALRMWLNP